MKTKTQLEKEIEGKEKEYSESADRKRLSREIVAIELNQLKATLTQTNGIIKLIEEHLNYYDNQPMTDEFSKGFQHSCDMFRKELLTKIKGEEK